MQIRSPWFAGVAPALLFAAFAAPAHAAESYDNCSGFIESLPANITTQGVWCMKADKTGNLASGAAITVAVNNVTIDCNGFKLGNLAAGPENSATGISAFSRVNTTVRNCNVRGYGVGISVLGTGHLVEDNRIESSGSMGIFAGGDGNTVRRNFIVDTGTGTQNPSAAIMTNAQVDVLDNTITGVFAVVGGGQGVMGILSNPGMGGRIEGNAIRGLVADGDGTPYGIFINNTGGGVSVARNRITNEGADAGSGIQCAGKLASMLVDNHTFGFADGWIGCVDIGLNHAL